MRYIMTVDTDGTVRGLYDDRLPWRDLGRLRVTRASSVEFDEARQLWVARAGGREIAAAPTREECLRREAAALQEGNRVAETPK